MNENEYIARYEAAQARDEAARDAFGDDYRDREVEPELSYLVDHYDVKDADKD